MSQTYTLERALEDGWKGAEATYFAAFLNAVNQIVVAETDFTIWDFIDWDWTEAFYSGKSVSDVADDFLCYINAEYGYSYNSTFD